MAIDHPHLLHSAVLIATRSRSDAARRAQAAADLALLESGIRLPAEYEAAMTALQMLSPATLNDDDAISTWLTVRGGAPDATDRTGRASSTMALSKRPDD